MSETQAQATPPKGADLVRVEIAVLVDGEFRDITVLDVPQQHTEELCRQVRAAGQTWGARQLQYELTPAADAIVHPPAPPASPPT